MIKNNLKVINKKGVSNVVTTIILVAIALVIAGIAYGFISGALGRADDSVQSQQDRLDAILNAKTCIEIGDCIDKGILTKEQACNKIGKEYTSIELDATCTTSGQICCSD